MSDRRPYPPGPAMGPLKAYRARRKDILGMLTSVAADHPRVAHLRVLNESVYLVSDPDLVHEALVVRSRSVRKGSGFERAIPFLGEGLFTNDGEVHKRHRRALQPAFHRARIAEYGQLMIDIARGLPWHDGEQVDVAESMGRLTLSVATQALFGSDIDDADVIEAREALHEFVSIFQRLGSPHVALLLRMPTPLRRRFEASRIRFDTVLNRLVEQRRAALTDDFLSMLLQSGMTDSEIFDEVRTFVPASHETTANALTWTLWLLDQHPEVRERLHREVDALPGLPEADDMPRLHYTRAVIAESMRLYPPIYVIGRRAQEDLTVDGWPIAAGARLITSPWVTHRDPRWWGDDALEYRPGRWLDDAGEFSQDRPGQPRMAYFPFGMGPRVCIGEGFAWMETILVVATIARQWRTQVLNEVKPLPGPMLRTDGPVQALIHSRTAERRAPDAGSLTAPGR
ncbi:cytochrome P450 [Actinoplanes sp. NPDC049118]|uniref:cytochrome P450 n=1 Tax=Actinoplanes sp. NPDC049118 TaxID=3155769 RepID=UPI0033D5A573